MLFRSDSSALARMRPRCFLVGLWLATASADTEKAIFVAPEPINIPSTHPNLDDLHVHTLTPGRWTVRTHLEAQFPSTTAPAGKATWLVLDELTEGQRYEVRVCWAATVSRARLRPPPPHPGAMTNTQPATHCLCPESL